jgi:uncharacterized membrane protein YgaE (UPF0421/DUF939 family)
LGVVFFLLICVGLCVVHPALGIAVLVLGVVVKILMH